MKTLFVVIICVFYVSEALRVPVVEKTTAAPYDPEIRKEHRKEDLKNTCEAKCIRGNAGTHMQAFCDDFCGDVVTTPESASLKKSALNEPAPLENEEKTQICKKQCNETKSGKTTRQVCIKTCTEQ